MASSEDYKKLYELYQVEGVPQGISIVDSCQRRGFVYKQFERWFKKRYSQNEPAVHQVRLVDSDSGAREDSSEVDRPVQQSSSPTEEKSPSPTRLFLSIRTSRGLSIQQDNLTYWQLLSPIEKLEVLC